MHYIRKNRRLASGRRAKGVSTHFMMPYGGKRGGKVDLPSVHQILSRHAKKEKRTSVGKGIGFADKAQNLGAYIV